MNDRPERQINFDAAASLRKWPSIRGQRNEAAKYQAPYLVVEGTLAECLRELMSRSKTQRHLYEIHTPRQGDLVTEVIPVEHATELARLLELIADRHQATNDNPAAAVADES